jgi:hypothetical protein
MDLKYKILKYEELSSDEEEKVFSKKKNTNFNYILIFSFLLLIGTNIFFLLETKKINTEIENIKNVTNVPYDLFGYDSNNTVLFIDIFFLIISLIIFTQTILFSKCYCEYFSLFIVILYLLLPSIQINFIISTLNLKKYIIYNIQKYIISSSLYISSYILFSLIVLGIIIKNK